MVIALMETPVTIHAVNRKLTTEQIEAACRDLLSSNRRVTVRGVVAELRRRHGASGRMDRVGQILSRLESAQAFAPAGGGMSGDVTALLARLKDAEARATRSEEIERRHQDYWAKRYAEKADELERKYAAALQARPAISTDQYLRLQHRVMRLMQRLSQYESVEP